MSLTAALLLLCLAGPPVRAEPAAQVADAWLASDKIRHGFGAYAATAFTFAGARLVFDRDAALGMAAAAAVAASIGKEWLDARRGGRASVRDLVWDAAGIAAALLLLRATR